MLGTLGVVAGACSMVTATFNPAWPKAAEIAVCALFGMTAIGWNGVQLAEVARHSPRGKAGAITGASGFVTFAGVVVGPPMFALLAALTGSYAIGFVAIGAGQPRLRCLVAAPRGVSGARIEPQCARLKPGIAAWYRKSKRVPSRARSSARQADPTPTIRNGLNARPTIAFAVAARSKRHGHETRCRSPGNQGMDRRPSMAFSSTRARNGRTYLIEQVIDQSRRRGAHVPFSANTAYINTIPVDKQPKMPGDQTIEEKIRNYARWNAMAMVVRANKDTNVGGHIASYASAATLYDVGFNHFWHAPSAEHGGDLVFVQGHSAPGVYARAFMLGRLTVEQMDNFRQEVDGKGISSYPHPWLMPDFWQFPTVSMGLGALDGDLPGALHEVSAGPRSRQDRGPQGVVLLRRRRDGRARIDGRHRHGRAREAATTSFSSSTAICSASTVRCAATARSSRSSKPISAAPAGTSSR